MAPKVWVISGEGMPVYGYYTSEAKALEAWKKYRHWDTPNQPNDPWGTHCYPLECEDDKEIKD